MEEAKKRKAEMDLFVKIANIAKSYGFKLAIGDNWGDAADDISTEFKELKDCVKHNNILDCDEKNIIYSETTHFLGRGAAIILAFESFDYATIDLKDTKYLDMAEKVETVLLSSPLSEDVSVLTRRYWKCSYCGHANDAGVKCSNCGASRRVVA